MCRKRELYGFCMIAFGAGLLIGWGIHSWFWCCVGGLIMVGIGLYILGHR